LISGGKIATGLVIADSIVAGTITGDKMVANTITATQIDADAITASELAANSVYADNIVAGTLTATEIATNAITTAKINGNAVTVSSGYSRGAYGLNAYETSYMTLTLIVTENAPVFITVSSAGRLSPNDTDGGDAYFYLKRGSTVLQTYNARTSTGSRIDVTTMFALKESPGIGTHTYSVWARQSFCAVAMDFGAMFAINTLR
jgi:hypothetical protein